jgi:hypothetical protein
MVSKVFDQGSSGVGEWAINCAQQNLKFFFGSNTDTGTDCVNNSWTHLVLVRDYTNADMRIYQNAVNVYNNTNCCTVNINKSWGFLIGTESKNSNTRYFPGWIDELAVWNQSLNDDDIRTLYQMGKNGIPIKDSKDINEETLYLDDENRVGIGVEPTQKLDVNGNMTVDSGVFFVNADDNLVLANGVDVCTIDQFTGNYSNEYSQSGFKVVNWTSLYDAEAGTRFSIGNYSTEYSSTGYRETNVSDNHHDFSVYQTVTGNVTVVQTGNQPAIDIQSTSGYFGAIKLLPQNIVGACNSTNQGTIAINASNNQFFGCDGTDWISFMNSTKS